MDIQPLSNTLRQLVMKVKQDKNKQRRGGLPYQPHTVIKLSQIMARQIVEPIIKDVSNTTQRYISYQHGTSIGFYFLLVDGRKFVVLYIPNPGSGAIFIKPLNCNGKQCAPSSPLKDTSSIVDCLRNFEKQSNVTVP